ncbi:hypothetical protein SB767_33675, partial [Bacillus sp. SIMBA_069]
AERSRPVRRSPPGAAVTVALVAVALVAVTVVLAVRPTLTPRRSTPGLVAPHGEQRVLDRRHDVRFRRNSGIRLT